MKAAARLLLFLLAATLAAADFASLKPQGYVSDFAKVLDAGTVAQLNDYCRRLQDATGAQIAIVTIQTLEGEPVEDVADVLFRKWGIGQKNENNGALFLLVIRDRKSRLEVGYGLEPIIPDGFAGGVLRQMRPALRQGDYRTALATATAEIGGRILQEKGVKLEGPVPRRAPPSREPGLPAWVIMAGIAALAAIFGGGRRGIRGRHTPGLRGGDVITGLILGSMMGGGRRSRGGGGFGGYDSGDSFGGFGGGDSGGGGASSGW